GHLLCPNDTVRSAPFDLSGRLLVVQSVCVAAAFRVRRLVRPGGRTAIVAAARFPTDLLAGRRLSLWGLLHYLDLVFPAAGRRHPGLAGAPDLPDQQDRFRHIEVRPFPCAGRRHAPLRSERLERIAIALASASYPLRAVLAPGFCARGRLVFCRLRASHGD